MAIDPRSTPRVKAREGKAGSGLLVMFRLDCDVMMTRIRRLRLLAGAAMADHWLTTSWLMVSWSTSTKRKSKQRRGGERQGTYLSYT